MATYYTGAAKYGPRSGVGGGSQTVTAYAEFSLSAALALNDVIQMIQVPAGAKIIGMTLGSTDVDTGGSPTITLSVGDGSSANRFINAATVGQTGGVTSTLQSTGAFGYQYTAADTIDVTVAAGPATGATTGTISLRCDYVIDRPS